MDKIIADLENQINELNNISETVTFSNASESLQQIGDKLDDFLILHKASLVAILDELKTRKNLVALLKEIHYDYEITGGIMPNTFNKIKNAVKD